MSSPSRRNAAAAALLLLTGCGVPPDLVTWVEADASLNAAQFTRPSPRPNPRLSPAPRFSPIIRPTPRPDPRVSPSANPVPSPSAGTPPVGSTTGEPLEAEDVLLRVFANGTARTTGRNPQFLSFSIQATEDPETGLTLGTLFMSDSINNQSFFGAMTAGNITHASAQAPGNSGGTATFTGVLARGTAFTLTVTDRNSATQRDTLTFNVPGQRFSFTGEVFRKDIQIVRAARPMEPYDEAPLNTWFDHAIGMYLLADDAIRRARGPQEPKPPRVIDLTPPEPIIDFQRNRLGGLVQPPGWFDNVPNANPDIDPFVTPYYDPEGFPNNNEIERD